MSLRALVLQVSVLALAIAASAEGGRSTTLVMNTRDRTIHSITPSPTNSDIYFIAGEGREVFSKLQGVSGADSRADASYLTIAWPVGSPSPVAIGSNSTELVAREVPSMTEVPDAPETFWTCPAFDWRDMGDFTDMGRAGFLTIREPARYRVINVVTGEDSWTLDAAANSVSADAEGILNSTDGRMILLMNNDATDDTELAIAFKDSPVRVVKRTIPATAIRWGAISPSGSMLACRTVDSRSGELLANTGRVRFFDAETLADRGVIDDGFVYLRNVAFSPDGTKLGVLTGPDFRVYDVATKLRLDRIPIPDEDIGTAFAFSNDGKRVYLGTQSGKIHLVDLILVRPDVDVPVEPAAQ